MANSFVRKKKKKKFKRTDRPFMRQLRRRFFDAKRYQEETEKYIGEFQVMLFNDFFFFIICAIYIIFIYLFLCFVGWKNRWKKYKRKNLWIGFLVKELSLWITFGHFLNYWVSKNTYIYIYMNTVFMTKWDLNWG